MKTLYVLRHAKSEWGDSSLRDFDRPLNGRGWKAAKAMGREFRERGMEPQLVLVSPALRTKQTLARFEEGFGTRLEASDDRRIYLAETETLIALVRSVRDGIERLMIVGHNPGMHELVLALTAAPSHLRDEVAHKYPTAAAAEIHFDAVQWADVETGSGRLAQFLRPRDL